MVNAYLESFSMLRKTCIYSQCHLWRSSQTNETDSGSKTNLESLEHGRKLVIALLDLANQVVALKELLDTLNLLSPFESGPDFFQFTEAR